jgi:DNA-binding IclR family transcriptional regulator
MASNNGSDNSVAVIERVADILESLSESDSELGITELHNRLGLSKSTVYRLVSTLVKRNYLEQNPVNQKYRLGSTILRLGLVGLRSLDVRNLALPIMERLREKTGETITLSLKSNSQRLYIAQVESKMEIRQTVDVGRSHPLYLGGSGKVILAYLAVEEQTEVLEDAGKDSRYPVNLSLLRRELEDIKQKGYSLSRGERIPDAASVAAPVFDHSNVVVGSMSVAGPISRLTVERQTGFVPALLEHANELSRKLGAPL